MEAFLSSTLAVAIAEIGDKTQIATILLAARYQEMFWVVAGSTLGLMLANVPVVYLGEKLIRKIPAKAVRIAACLLFCVMGVMTLMGEGIAL